MHPNKMFTIQITKNTCSFKTVSTREKQKYSHGAGGAHKTTRTSYFEGCANAACKEQWSDIVHPPSSDYHLPSIHDEGDEDMTYTSKLLENVVRIMNFT